MSEISLNPYIFFTSNCKEAMEFYKSIFGGELTFQMNGDDASHEGVSMAGTVMHAHLTGGDAVLMASDGSRRTPYETSCITLSLNGSAADTEKLTAAFNKLSEGGKVEHELTAESWGDVFGMVTDKYGIDWIVNISGK